MDRENVEYDGLIFGLKEYPAICDNTGKSGEQYVKWYKIQNQILHDESKEKVVLIETESRMAVAVGYRNGENGESLEKGYTFSVIKWIMAKDHMYNIVGIVDDTVLYNSNLPREYNLLVSPKWKKKKQKNRWYTDGKQTYENNVCIICHQENTK